MMNERNNFDHYVAQYYIKKFVDSSGAVFVGDIKTKIVESMTDVSRIMGNVNWSVTQDIEDNFSKIETTVANALKRIVSDPMAISGLALATRRGLRDFITMHHLRSVGIHANMENTYRQMGDALGKMSPNNEEYKSLSRTTLERSESLAMGAETAAYLEPVFEEKGCVALLAPQDVEFILGDNPLAVLSSQESWPYRGAAFMDETYFWFPLNPKMGLFFATGLGGCMLKSPIVSTLVSEKIVKELNRAEVYLANEKVVGSRRGQIRLAARYSNIGSERSEIHDLKWAPFIIAENKEYHQVAPGFIERVSRSISR